MREIRTLRSTWRGLETWHGIGLNRRASPRPYLRARGGETPPRDSPCPWRRPIAEDVERPAAEPHRCLIAPQLAPREVKSEPAEADLALDHRIDLA